ncbi:MAG: translational GTPase TypA [Candidatus Dormibacteraeota bacterium]|uniref:Large ribosomal subunit assembly factor BipA n=1 Tax=Candidatus Dormiibacter inghamiae TaxID=3127013 RepID=A0A934K891_9BACT|nr:translational GTPase TypA [Candidatus Dormibacteraeota bacterium]MBJ7604900.1 translational GTPase TypA [Candidatus Dormibacteraeota bacterium]
MPKLRHDIRNVAIIAHVDHGKTTLVDALLKQSHTFRENQEMGSLIMDSNSLEREKGITILAKNAAIRHQGVTINIIDTPGHSDFGGEVERVLNMADGCLLLVDAAEGPMPQTRFVLQKAFEVGLRIIVVINKLDRPNSDAKRALEQVHDLFLELAEQADQLDAPVIYAIAKQGRSGPTPEALEDSLEPLFQAIRDHVPAPVAEEGGFQMLVANRAYDDYTGTLAIGRIFRGSVGAGDEVSVLTGSGEPRRAKVGQVLLHRGLGRESVERADAGDIALLTGLADVTIGDTLADPESPDPLPRIQIEEPTVRMTFGVNRSPVAGREGKFSTSRQLRARLYRELELNLGLRVEDTDAAEQFQVSGRGELHLAVLIESMRREGYEFEVSRPQAILKHVDGQALEPVERLTVDLREEYLGAVTEALGRRRAQMLEINYDSSGGVRADFMIPTRGLIGFRNAFLTFTAGTGIMGSIGMGFRPYAGDFSDQRNGALTASSAGATLTYGLAAAQERGTTFIEPGTAVYEGMIVGLQKRPGDMAVNVCREKKQSNIRSSTADIAVRLTPAHKLSLEQSLDFLNDDELLEVTPLNLRLRKRYLTEVDQARARRRAEAATG